MKWTVTFCLFFLTTIPLLFGDPFSFPRDDGKHDAKMEFWSVYSHLKDSSGKELSISVTFFSGSFFMFNGDVVMMTIIDPKKKQYLFRKETFIFGGIDHDPTALNERFGDSYLIRMGKSEKYKLHVAIDEVELDLDIISKKKSTPIHPTGVAQWGEGWHKGFALPGMNLSGTYSFDGKKIAVTGTGHFDHSWANQMEEDHDFMVISLENNLQLTVYYVYDENEHLPKPGSQINISFPDGRQKHISDKDIAFKIIEIWKSGETDKNYRLGWDISIPKEKINLRLMPSFQKQEVSAMGMEFWMGLGNVKAEISGKNINGKAFLMLQGYEK